MKKAALEFTQHNVSVETIAKISKTDLETVKERLSHDPFLAQQPVFPSTEIAVYTIQRCSSQGINRDIQASIQFKHPSSNDLDLISKQIFQILPEQKKLLSGSFLHEGT